MISNVVSVVTDLIHILKIILLCELLFGFGKHKDSKRYIIICFASVIVSEIMYFKTADVLLLILYIGLVFTVLYTIYVIKMWQALLLSVGIMFLATLIDTIIIVMIDMIFDISGFSEFIFKDLVESMVSMFMICILLWIYKRKYRRKIKWINLKNSAIFTILISIDTIIVLAIVTIYQSVAKEESKILFAIITVFVIMGMLFQLGTVFLLYSANGVYEENDALMKKYLNDQKKHYEYLEKREEETKKFRHDVRNHMQMLYYLQKKSNMMRLINILNY